MAVRGRMHRRGLRAKGVNRARFLLFVFALGAVMITAAAELRAQTEPAGARIALLIGNGNYPDADTPLSQPPRDARTFGDELKRNGFDVTIAENATKEQMRRGLEAFYGKIRPGTAAVIFFGGFGIQSDRESYLLPLNAQIWSERDVRNDGFSLDKILAEMNARGAGVKIAVVDASRRNPFERRFRGVSLGMAPANLPRETIVMYSASPGSLVSDADSRLFVSEMIKEMRAPDLTVAQIFDRTRIGVSRASRNEQVPWISSSLVEDFYFNRAARPATPGPSASLPPPVVEPPRPSIPSPPPVAQPAPAPVPAPSAVIEPAKPIDPEADAKRDYEAAERLNTRKAFQDFLAKHPTGFYAALGRDQLNRLPEAAPAPTPAPAPAKPAAPPPVAALPPKPAPSTPAPPPAPTQSEDDRRIAELDRTISQKPEDADSYYRRGQLYAKKRDFDRALKDFDQAIRLNPKDVEAYNNRCYIRAALGQALAAVADCDEALRLRPNYPYALDSRGFAHLKIGEYSRAIADFTAALRTDPKNAHALYGRGKAKMQLGDAAGGRADIAAAQSIQSDIADEYARFGLGL
jgi:tetratricopeptide (TPR) repeat protein